MKVDDVNGMGIEVQVEEDSIVADPAPPGHGALQPHYVAGKRILGKGCDCRKHLLAITCGKFSGCFFDAVCDS